MRFVPFGAAGIVLLATGLSAGADEDAGVADAGEAAGRADLVDAGLWHDARRVRLAECFDQGPNPCSSTTARVGDLAGYAEEDAQLLPGLDAIAGVRYDLFAWDVDPGGAAQRGIVSPKLSLIARPDPALDRFANGGLGFHSNDARAAVQAPDGALARAARAELGARVRPRPGLEASAALWYLHLSSEQVWNGDVGGTEAAGASARYGLDLDVVWSPRPWLAIDADLELAHAELVDRGAVPLAPRLLGGGGITLHAPGSSLALRARGLGPRPANPEDTLTADGYLVLDLVAAHAVGPWRLGITVDNLLDSAWREAQFAETSRLAGEPAPVSDIHFTPGTPLVVLLTVAVVVR